MLGERRVSVTGEGGATTLTVSGAVLLVTLPEYALMYAVPAASPVASPLALSIIATE
jgi:hypothetical protein